MSLVNDALKKARLEAARGDAANRSIPYPLLGRGEQPANRVWIVALAVLALLVAAGGFFLFRAGERSALKANSAEPAADLAASAEPTVSLEPAAPLERAAAPEPSRPNSVAANNLPTRSAPAQPQPGREQAAPARVVPKTGARSAGPDSNAGEADRRQRSVEPTPVEPRPSVATTTPVPVRNRPAQREPVVETSEAPPRTEPDNEPAGVDPESPAPSAQLEADASPAADEDIPANDTAPREFLRKAEIDGVGEISLGGIAWSGDRPFALINGRVVRPGDSVSGLLVEDIQPNTVRLQGDQGALVLKLK